MWQIIKPHLDLKGRLDSNPKHDLMQFSLLV